jgi:TRAP-type C4-dicarboxylate transport system permease small subunit
MRGEKMVNLIIALNKKIRKFEEFIISYGIIIMSIVLVANVFSRVVLNSSIQAAEEIGQILIVTVTFLGVSYAARMGKHITMSALIDSIPRRFKKPYIYFTSSVSTVLLWWLGYLGTLYVNRIMVSGRITPSLQFPMWILYIFVPIGFFLASLQYLVTIVMNIKDKENIYIGSERTLSEDDISCELNEGLDLNPDEDLKLNAEEEVVN